MRARLFLVFLSFLPFLSACSNAGKDNTLSVTATGTVFGFAYFDADASKSLTNADTALGGVKVRLYAAGDTIHALESATTQTSGRYHFPAVPVGVYTVRVDTTTIPAGQGVLKVDSTSFTVLPNDSVEIDAAVGFPTVSIRAARALPAGRTVFLAGVILNNSVAFSDSIVSLEDTSGAIFVTRLRNGVSAGDSVRVRGVTARRDSLPVLDDVHVFPQGTGLIQPAVAIDNARGNTADSGRLDAHLIIVKSDSITDPATVAGNFLLTVKDSSGTAHVLLDRAADQSFNPLNAPPNGYVPGSKFTIVGLLVPSDSAGVWQIRPRNAVDMKKL